MGEGYSQGARPNLTSTSYAPYFRNAPTLHKTHNKKKLHNVSHTEQQFAKSRKNELRETCRSGIVQFYVNSEFESQELSKSI
jgi:hypothetical protein